MGDHEMTLNEDTDESSPVLPNPARLADSSEIREFDRNFERIPEEKNANGKPGPIIVRSPRRRYYSQGEGKNQRSYPTSFSIDDDNAISGYVQLYVLDPPEVTGVDEREWSEVSRWVKYEQDLEEGSERLGKPHIAPLTHLYLSKLQMVLTKGCVDLLDLDEGDMPSVAAKVAEALVNKGYVDRSEAAEVLNDMLRSHKHVEERKHHHRGSLQMRQRADSLAVDSPLGPGERRHSINRRIVHTDSLSSAKLGSPDHVHVEVCETPPCDGRRRGSRRGTLSSLVRFFSTEDFEFGGSTPFLPFSAGAESSMIMVREGYKRRNGALVLVRLITPVVLDTTEGEAHFPIPTRFIILVLAPKEKEEDFVEIGRSLGTLMSNRRFYKNIRNAKDIKGVLAAIPEFLEESIILPPGKWYNHNFHDLLPVHVLEEKCDLINQKKRARGGQILHRCGTSKSDGFGLLTSDSGPEGELEGKNKIPGPFDRTKKLFGGLINDVRRRYPLYKSDILDGLNSQTLATIIFLYFAAIAHNVTFGGLLGQKTNGLIGVPETLIAAGSSGVIYALFSGQPFNIIAPTGPLLVFDELLYKFMERHEIEFLPARFWIGIWVVIIAIVVIAFEGSIFVKNFTRFTMETFSALISVIFCYESLESLIHIYQQHPLTNIEGTLNSSLGNNNNAPLQMLNSSSEHEDHHHGLPIGEPNTALLSTFLMFGTFWVAYKLKHLRTGHLFPVSIRNFLADFGVPLGIMLMVSIDYLSGDVFTTKIKVPTGFQPTSPALRGWVIHPLGMEKPISPWLPLFAVVPGALVFLLMFMTCEICEKIMMSKGGLKKGSGLHLDPLILAFINFGSGLFGFPWVSVATLKALAHIAAQTVYSQNDPPGIPPSIVEIKENRISGMTMSILIGLSIFMAPVLKMIPMPVLFGVFLYMGITSFIPTQLYERIILFLVPVASHPQTIYVRRVPTWKMHMYTAIQIASLAALWAVKSVKEIALFFPLILMLLVPIRRSLQYFYTENELDALDGENPQASSLPPRTSVEKEQ